MPPVPDLSALHRAPRAATARSSPSPISKQQVRNWELPDTHARHHPAFDPTRGVYTVPRDGLYAVRVEVLPCDGRAHVSATVMRRPRCSVDYVLQVLEPPTHADGATGNAGHEEQFLDVGIRSLGEVLHLRKDATLALWALPSACGDSLRFKVELVQRKRKRSQEPELSAKELKKREKKRKRAEPELTAAANASTGKDEQTKQTKRNSSEPSAHADVDKLKQTGPSSEANERKWCSQEDRKSDGGDSSGPGEDAWSAEFSSDESGPEAEDEKRGVGRIAKKLRAAGTEERLTTS